ncbi:hypothetical protein PLANTIT3_80019 [Plantibacter sp. T3]|nr:hypothetical protein PLANTIT3_80019 [Plantibacter sp. T3]
MCLRTGRLPMPGGPPTAGDPPLDLSPTQDGVGVSSLDCGVSAAPRRGRPEKGRRVG